MRTKYQKEAQKFQDDIFKNMTADKKIELVSGMWHLVNNLKTPNLNKNGKYNGSKRPSGRDRRQ